MSQQGALLQYESDEYKSDVVEARHLSMKREDLKMER